MSSSEITNEKNNNESSIGESIPYIKAPMISGAIDAKEKQIVTSFRLKLKVFRKRSRAILFGPIVELPQIVRELTIVSSNVIDNKQINQDQEMTVASIAKGSEKAPTHESTKITGRLEKIRLGKMAPFCLMDLLMLAIASVNCLMLSLHSPYTPDDAVARYVSQFVVVNDSYMINSSSSSSSVVNQQTLHNNNKYYFDNTLSENELLVQAPKAIIVDFERPHYSTVIQYFCIWFYGVDVIFRVILLGPQWYVNGIWAARIFDLLSTIASVVAVGAELTDVVAVPSRWLGVSALKLCLFPFIVVRAHIWPKGAAELLDSIGGALFRSLPQFTFFFSFIAACALIFLGLLNGEMKGRCVLEEWTNVSSCFVEYSRFLSIVTANNYAKNNNDSTDYEYYQTKNIFAPSFLESFPDCAPVNSTNIRFLRSFNLSDSFLGDIENFVCGGAFDSTVLEKPPSVACSQMQVCIPRGTSGSGYSCPFGYRCKPVENLYGGIVGFDNYLQALFSTFVASSEKLWYILGPAAADSSMDAFFFVFVLFICLSVLILNVTIVTLCMEYEKSLAAMEAEHRNEEQQHEKEKKRKEEQEEATELDNNNNNIHTFSTASMVQPFVMSKNGKDDEGNNNNNKQFTLANIKTDSSVSSSVKRTCKAPRIIYELVHDDIPFAFFSFSSAILHILFLCLRTDRMSAEYLKIIQAGDFIFICMLFVETFFRLLGGPIAYFSRNEFAAGVSDLLVLISAAIGIPLEFNPLLATRVLRSARAFCVYYGQIQTFLKDHPAIKLKPWKIPQRWYRALKKSLLSSFILLLAIINLVLLASIAMQHGAGGWLCRLQVNLDNLHGGGPSVDELVANDPGILNGSSDINQMKASCLANDIFLQCPQATHESFGDSFLTVWQIISGDDWDLLTFDEMRLVTKSYGLICVVIFLLGFVVLTSVFSSSLLAAYLNEAELDMERERDEAEKMIQEKMKKIEVEQKTLERKKRNQERRKRKAEKKRQLIILNGGDSSAITNNKNDDDNDNDDAVHPLLRQHSSDEDDNQFGGSSDFGGDGGGGSIEFGASGVSQSVAIFDSLQNEHRHDKLKAYKIRADRLLRRSVLADVGRSVESDSLIATLEKERTELARQNRVDDDSQWNETEVDSAAVFKMGLKSSSSMSAVSPSALKASGSNSNFAQNKNTSLDAGDTPSFYQKLEQFLRKVCDHTAFSVFSALITVIYVISEIIWDPTAAPDLPLAQAGFILDAAARSFCVVELILKILAYGPDPRKATSYWKRSVWNPFEATVTFIGVLGLILRVSVPRSSSITLLRAFDALFAFRPLTIVRHSTTMQIVVRSLFRATSDLFEATIMILIFLILVAFVGSQLFSGWMQLCVLDGGRGAIRPEVGIENCTEIGGVWTNRGSNFDQIFQGLWSVFIIMTREMWADSMRRAMEYNGYGVPLERNAAFYACLYFVVVSMIALVVTNVFMAVLVEAYNRCKRSAAAQMSLQTIREQNAWIRSERRLLHVLPAVVQQELLDRKKNNVSFTSAEENVSNNNNNSITSIENASFGLIATVVIGGKKFKKNVRTSFASFAKNANNNNSTNDKSADDTKMFENNNSNLSATTSPPRTGDLELIEDIQENIVIRCFIHTRHYIVHFADDWRVKLLFSSTSFYCIFLLLFITDPTPTWIEKFLDVNEYVLCGIFWAEVLLWIAGVGFRVYIRNGWNRVDLVAALVSLAMLIVRILHPSFSPRYRTVSWFLKITRAIKLSKGTWLRTLFVRFGDTLRRLTGVLALMVFFFFGFSVVANRLFGRVVWGPVGTNQPNHQNAFRGAFLGMFYLLRLSLGGSWPAVWWNLRAKAPGCDPNIGDCGPPTPIPEFFIFIFIITFTFILKNLLVAVAVDVFTSSGDFRSLLKVDAQTTTKLWMITQTGKKITNPIQLRVLFTERVIVNGAVLRFIRSLPPEFPTSPIWQWEALTHKNNSNDGNRADETKKNKSDEDNTFFAAVTIPRTNSGDLESALSVLEKNGNSPTSVASSSSSPRKNNKISVSVSSNLYSRRKEAQSSQGVEGDEDDDDDQDDDDVDDHKQKKNEGEDAHERNVDTKAEDDDSPKQLNFKKRGLLEPSILLRVLEVLFVSHQIRWRKEQVEVKKFQLAQEQKLRARSASAASSVSGTTSIGRNSFISRMSFLAKRQNRTQSMTAATTASPIAVAQDENTINNPNGADNNSFEQKRARAQSKVKFAEESLQKQEQPQDGPEQLTTVPSASNHEQEKAIAMLDAVENEALQSQINSEPRAEGNHNDETNIKQEEILQQDEYELSKPVTCTFSEVCDVLLSMAFMAPEAPDSADRSFNTIDFAEIRREATPKDWEKANEFAFDLWLAEGVANVWKGKSLARKIRNHLKK